MDINSHSISNTENNVFKNTADQTWTQKYQQTHMVTGPGRLVSLTQSSVTGCCYLERAWLFYASTCGIYWHKFYNPQVTQRAHNDDLANISSLDYIPSFYSEINLKLNTQDINRKMNGQVSCSQVFRSLRQDWIPFPPQVFFLVHYSLLLTLSSLSEWGKLEKVMLGWGRRRLFYSRY